MTDLPGAALLIDDKFKFVEDFYQKNSEKYYTENAAEFFNLVKFENYFIERGIPVLRYHSTDINEFKDFIDKINNIRLVVLDLDLDGDGEVGDVDKEVVREMLEILKEKLGYFFVIIYSAHSEEWNDIRDELSDELKSIINHLEIITKEEPDGIESKIREALDKISSLAILFPFEKNLQKSIDKMFSNLAEFDMDTWKVIIQNLKRETGNLWEYELINLLLNMLKNYYMPKEEIFKLSLSEEKIEYDRDTISRIYRTFNYITGLPEPPVFTGNIYKTEEESSEREYALIITPECDIAQNKHDGRYLAIYGFNIKENFSRGYGRNPDDDVPLYVRKSGKKSNGKYKSYNKLNEFKSPHQYIYILPFVLEDGNHIAFDFRVAESVPEANIKKWKFIARVNEPLITDIMDQFSNVFNRKGLPSLIPKGMKLIENDR